MVLPKAMRALSDALTAIEKIEGFLNLPTADRKEMGKQAGIEIVSPPASSPLRARTDSSQPDLPTHPSTCPHP